MVAALIVPGSEIILRDVGLNPRRTGLLAALRRMGADIAELDRSEIAWRTARRSAGARRPAYRHGR